MPKIRQITKIDVVPARTFELGDLINDVPIAVFEDKSVELNSGAIENLYLAKDNKGELLVAIEKCPVIVYYRNIDIEEEMNNLTEIMGEIADDVIKDIEPLNEPEEPEEIEYLDAE